MKNKAKKPEAMQNYTDDDVKNFLIQFDDHMNQLGNLHVISIILAGDVIEGSGDITLGYQLNYSWDLMSEATIKKMIKVGSSKLCIAEYQDLSNCDILFTKHISKDESKYYKNISDDFFEKLDSKPMDSGDRTEAWMSMHEEMIAPVLQELLHGLRQQILNLSKKVYSFPNAKNGKII